jgi:Zinc carboxypeptidase/RTX calcium-binding nonapeptide repeat (4 copies)
MTTTFLTQDFSTATTTPPDGWTIDVIEGDPAVDLWRFDNPGDRTLPSFLTNPAAIFDSDNVSNNNLKENVALVSPTFDASGSSQVYLKFDQEYLGLADPDFGSKGFIEVYDGTTWQTVTTQVEDAIAPTTIDISQYVAGVANAQVRFRWEGNWSYRWSLDNVEIVDTLTPGVRLISTPQTSEDNVPDTRNFKFVLEKPPTADVTLSFAVDGQQLEPIDSVTFTPENWNVPQTATVRAIADGVAEGNEQTSPIKISLASDDPSYSGLVVEDGIASITDNAIPGFLSYRTVEKTRSDVAALATNNPTIASWVDIGDSYDKTTPGGAEGYDLNVLELTNKNIQPAGGKPVVYLEAGIHAREYSTNEVLTRFAESLVAGYGLDADTTWLLDYFEIDINPVVNPDGRKFAEQGYLWRKNTNPNPPEGSEAAAFPTYGVDLNRNHDFEWNTVEGGSSGDPASDVYRGASAASEPETQAVENYVKAKFPDRRGSEKTDAAPDDTSGLFIDIHSFGNTFLYPWGSTSDPAPNQEGLRNLGLKFGYYTNANGTPYDVYQAIGLYPTDGTTDEWAYGTLGIPAYTWELGTEFFESSEYFEESIAPQIIPALFYAAKSAYQPYKTSAAPESINVTVDVPQVVTGAIATVNLTATADDTRYADSNADTTLEEGKDLPAPSPIKGARYSIDAPSWIAGTKLYDLVAADGAFDSAVEGLTAIVDTTSLAPGRHTLFVESQDENGDYGVPSAVFLDVLAAPDDAVIIKGTEKHDVLTASDDKGHVIYGFGDNDSLLGGGAADVLLAGNGQDIVLGEGGDDLIYGGMDDDYVVGGKGGDKLYGEAGNDFLNGSEGDDLLWGGKGSDMLKGGEGNDKFVLAYNEGSDIIQDFEIGKDRIGLAGTLNFSQLSITEDDKAAFISLGKNQLAEVLGVKAEQLVADLFTSVSPIA